MTARRPTLKELVGMIAPVAYPKDSRGRNKVYLAIRYARKIGELPADPADLDMLCAWARREWPTLRDLPGFPDVELVDIRLPFLLQRSCESFLDALRAKVEIPKKRADLEEAYRTAEAERRILLAQLADCAHTLESKLLQKEELGRRRSEYAKRPRE